MSDIVEHPEAYFKGFIPERDRLFLDLEAEARNEDIPIVGPVVGELLYILARATGARNILELGTATGYSTLFLAKAARENNGRVMTIENAPAMAERAAANLKNAGLSDWIDIKIGDAAEVMKNLVPPFDLIFLDIDKEFYDPSLPHCRRLLKPGGLLVADNTGFIDSGEFNTSIMNSPDWRSVQLFSFLPGHSPEYDGLCLAVRV